MRHSDLGETQRLCSGPEGEILVIIMYCRVKEGKDIR